MTKDEKETLRLLFLEKGVRATKVAEVLGINRATVYAACNPESNRYVSAEKHQKIKEYLNHLNT